MGHSIAVVGSANMDLVLGVDAIPRPGETVLATSSSRFAGGKGLNQAVAAARSGGSTVFIGAVGDDDFGAELIAALRGAGVDSSLIRATADPTGQAVIAVDARAENVIIVSGGANATIATLTEDERRAVTDASALLMQLEVPLSVVTEAAHAAQRAGTHVVLNAAPAQSIPDDLLSSLDCLIVNEHEACAVAGTDDLDAAMAVLAARVPRLVVTLGVAGSALFENGLALPSVPAHHVTAVDTTGAGDTYCGALVAALAEGSTLEQAARFATAAAALSVQTAGAVPSIPTRERTEAELARHQHASRE